MLSDYIIALLKHDASEAELAALLNEQLSDFLDSSECTRVLVYQAWAPLGPCVDQSLTRIPHSAPNRHQRIRCKASVDAIHPILPSRREAPRRCRSRVHQLSLVLPKAPCRGRGSAVTAQEPSRP